MSGIHLVRPNEGVTGRLRILAGGAQTNGAYFALEWETAPGALDPASVHTHEVEAESEYVLTGEREIQCGDQQWRGGEGLFVFAPERTPHTMRTLGDKPSRWLHFFSPAGLEHFFAAREQMLERKAPPEEISALAKRYGIGRSDGAGHAPPFARPPANDAASRRVVAAPEETGGAYALVEMRQLADAPHAHEQDEAFYVIGGELTVESDGQRVKAPARSFVVIPRGLPHRHALSDRGRSLAVFSPAALPH